MKTKIIISLIILILLSALLFFAFRVFSQGRSLTKQYSLPDKKEEGWRRLKAALKNKVSRFKGTVGLVIEDLDTGREIAFNEDSLIPSASLVKVPIMLSCFYAAKDGKITLKDSVRLKHFERVAGSKVLGNEPVGSVFTVEELFSPMITQSDNAAANVLIDYLGFDTLNAYFKKMGLKNTNLARRMMDFRERREGEENYTTAQDMAYLLEQLYNNKFLDKGVSGKCLELLGEQKINDRIPRKLPKGTFVVHKTGLERHICHDAGIVFTDRGNFLICVLARHQDRYAQNTKKFISDITLMVYNYYQSLE